MAVSTTPEEDFLDQPLSVLKGVGPARVQNLAKLEIKTLRNLLQHVPRHYENWGPAVSIEKVQEGQEVTVRGIVKKVSLQRIHWRKSFLRVTLEDQSGKIDGLFFNQHYLQDKFKVGETIAFHGKVKEGKRGLFIPAPKMESLALPFPEKGKIVPVYPLVEGVGQSLIQSLVSQALDLCSSHWVEQLSENDLIQLKCVSIGEAYNHVHRPTQMDSLPAARRRIALAELIELQESIQKIKISRAGGSSAKIVVDTKLHERILSRIPFTLTDSQKKVVAEIRTDLASGIPMRRLLQGDVGSGKTAVAVYACLAALGKHHQAAFMAPTEILAEQQAKVLRQYLDRSKINVALLHGSLKKSERTPLLEGIRSGEIQLVVGTHALISQDVVFKDLALAVVDEQHRFGVGQREKLFLKGKHPHWLTMTATPIPRTLAMTFYGDLDISILTDKPPGRGELETKWVPPGKEKKLIPWLAKKMETGERVYWVSPRIGEGEEEGKSAQESFVKLKKTFGNSFSLGLVHGQLPSEERDEILNQFRHGDIQLLVATTLIEVGIHVPEATVMVISGAERLGLAQLHQLRGRVGRGSKKSFCYLIGDAKAKDRMQFMEDHLDGFVIAEEDLRTRGQGELTGMRQSGFTGLTAVQWEEDQDLIQFAQKWVKNNPRHSATAKRALVD